MCRFATILALIYFLVPLEAQTTWEEVPTLAARTSAQLAYDPARGRLVLFGGAIGMRALGDTWEYDGVAWHLMKPNTSPAPRSLGHMVYDSIRRRCVLFGGRGVSHLNDMWEWDGSNWVARTSVAPPSPRSFFGMCFDHDRDRIVLFGGGDSVTRNDTWEWDGTQWMMRSPVSSPPAQAGSALVYDPHNRRTVLFGGSYANSAGNTWSWDGTDWTLLTTPTRPMISGGAMVYDAGRRVVFLFGGNAANRITSDETWELSGSTWTRRSPASSPLARTLMSMAYDSVRDRVLMFGGDTFLGGRRADLWEWDHVNWQPRALTPQLIPQERESARMAYDPSSSSVILFGGVPYPMSQLPHAGRGSTWAWNGAWSELASTGPQERFRHSMVTDWSRQRVVMFGGAVDTSNSLGDTWAFDRGSWTRIAVSGPKQRKSHAMAYDEARDRIVLFGGMIPTSFGTTILSDDTWEFDGSSWTRQYPVTVPSARSKHAMAYDRARGEVVMFGGLGSNATLLGDTWLWDGSDWRAASGGPLPRSDFALAYDSARQRTVLFGGSTTTAIFGDTWDWDGASWLRRAPRISCSPRSRVTLVEHRDRSQLLLIGGTDRLGRLMDTWLYHPQYPASHELYGRGCSGSAGVPQLQPSLGQLPWQGDQYALQLSVLPPLGGIVCVLVGQSRSAFRGFNLPLNLAPYGMPGCELYASPEMTVPVANVGGNASLTFALPNHYIMLGLEFYSQALVLDSGANPTGVVLTNAVAGVIGHR